MLSFESNFDIAKCKVILKQLTKYASSPDVVLSADDRALSISVRNACFSMFSSKKLEVKSFTVHGNSFLRTLEIEVDSAGLPEASITKVLDIFTDNIEAFYELAAQTFLPKTNLGTFPDNGVYFVSSKSRFCKDEIEFFIAKHKGKFVLFTNSIEEMAITTYVQDYIGQVTPELTERLLQLENDNYESRAKLQAELAILFCDISNHIMGSHTMINGVISFYDFLGWKGLWQSQSTEPLVAISNLITDFSTELESRSRVAYKLSIGNMSTLISISDTIAIFSPIISSVSAHELLQMHIAMAQYILEKSCQATYPIRGAISLGEYSIMNNVMIGPGIDECASWHEEGDWIGVYLTPSAQFYYNFEGKGLVNGVKPHKVATKKAGGEGVLMRFVEY